MEHLIFEGSGGKKIWKKKILQHLKRSGKEFMCDKLDIMNALLFNWKKSALFISWGGGGREIVAVAKSSNLPPKKSQMVHPLIPFTSWFGKIIENNLQ